MKSVLTEEQINELKKAACNKNSQPINPSIKIEKRDGTFYYTMDLIECLNLLEDNFYSYKIIKLFSNCRYLIQCFNFANDLVASSTDNNMIDTIYNILFNLYENKNQ